MKYEEFCKKLGYKGTETTAIGNLFDVRPQVVNNWRLRGRVPSDYVLDAMNRGLFAASKKAS